MDLPRLLLSGLFGFSLIFLAAISAAVQQLDQFGLVEWDDWFTAERAEAAAGLATVQVLAWRSPRSSSCSASSPASRGRWRAISASG